MYSCFQSLPLPVHSTVDGEERQLTGLGTLCRYSHCTGRHAGGHLQPGEAGHRRAVWSLYLGPSKREIMKMAFLFLSHGLVSLPCPGVSRVSSHTDSDPSRLAPVPVIDIQCLLHVASLYSSVLLSVSAILQTEEE